MRAKEYVEHLHQREDEIGFNTACWEMLCDFVEEIGEIRKTRNARSISALGAILNEQEQKWKAICRYEPRLKPDGFKELIQKQFPEVCEMWVESSAMLRWERMRYARNL